MRIRYLLLSVLLGGGIVVGLLGGVPIARGQDPDPLGVVHPQSALGTAFTYQGVLNDGNGPAQGAYDFRFRLYDASTGGNQVGSTVTLDDVSVSDGLFTVELDFGNVFDGRALWLEVAVRPGSSTGDYTALSPRQPLTATPYALYALGAGSVAWSDITGRPAGLDDGDDDTTYSAGTGLTLSGGVTLSLDTGYTDGRYWKLEGNGGTLPGTHFLGTTDNVTLTLAVSGTTALRLEPTDGTPNLIGGYGGNRVTAGVKGATLGGGGAAIGINRVTDDYGTVGGGYGNRAGNDAGTTNDAPYATVGGGQSNTASGTTATVGGGYLNTADGFRAAIVGGYANDASGSYAFVGGGYNNDISLFGPYTVIGGGYNNTASGYYAVVPGGYANEAEGKYSFAAGHQAHARHEGTFVWDGETTSGNLYSSNNGRFLVRAPGGIWFGATAGDITPTIGANVFISTSTGAYLTTGGTWTNASDRNLKENFALVDAQAVLEGVARLPIQSWNYKAEETTVRHLGPTAQDFYATFGLGADDRHIATVDADGVALASIQALYARNQALERRVAAQQAQIEALQRQNADLEARVAALETTLSQPSDRAGLLKDWLGPALTLLFVGLVWVRRGR
ncbi:MAG: hypothetical protein D6759_11170 [Chloroflexi bacterium]|nr:MAG: hypothetical protein D6759_11170 [Chloroflexota bacterium]